ncbi:hypothetical protein VVD49_06435 [Uliginosibacterium sp. H3]|uniref:Uncharacterized protein n=1 Tax=Uliginosibacterium silvisoli TaxID=3114758 RepID=A0ABU6K090_9RHOO|nr:hypothetical protein [Uliginosibacterium sp. H3]
MGAALAAPVTRPDKKPEASSGGKPDEEQTQESADTPAAGVPRYLSPDASGTPAASASEQHARNAAQCVDPNANPMSEAASRSEDELGAVAEEQQADAKNAQAAQRGKAAAAGEQVAEEAAPEVEKKADSKQAGGSDGKGGAGGSDVAEGGEGAEGADGGAEGASAEGADGGTGGEGGGGGSGGGGADGGGGSTGASSPATDGVATGGSASDDSGMAALGTGDLALIDTELAEHQRWGDAAAHVGAAGSQSRAQFVVEQAGSGFLTGAGSGFGTGLAIGLAARAVPVVGPILGGGIALHGLITGWGQTVESVGKFGEGSDTYETLANSIEAISAVINVVSGVLNLINSIVSIVGIAAGALTVGGAVATVLTLGAAAPIAIMAAEVAATCLEISEGITIVTTVLDGVNTFILQPSVTLFRALHTFTSQADPREVETQGAQISAAASQSGGALGGFIGGKAAGIGAKGGGKKGAQEEKPPAKAETDTPPAKGEGPVVHFDEPPAGKQSPGAPAPVEVPAVPGVDPHAPTVPAPAPVDPHAPTVPAPAPVDPHAPTVPAPAPVDPHAPTVPAPAPVDPHAPTVPAPVDPHAPTQPAPAPVDPHAPTMPAPDPVDPHAPTALPDEGPGVMPEIPKAPKVPKIDDDPGYGPEPDHRVPQPDASSAPAEAAPAAPAPRRISDDQTTVAPPEAGSTAPADTAAPTVPAAPDAVAPSTPLAAAPDAAVTAPASSTPAATGPGTGGELKAITPPLELKGFSGTEKVPQGLEPGAIGTYGRQVDNPHPFATESNPTTKGKMPDGRADAGVYGEHQTPAATANQVLPNHEYNGVDSNGNVVRRGGADTKDALVIALPDEVKPTKDRLDRALHKDVKDRVAAGENVAPIEVAVRGTQNTQEALQATGNTSVPQEQVTKNFLAEQQQFQNEKFGYQEVRPGEALPAGHPLRDVPQSEIDAHIDNLFDKHLKPMEPSQAAAPPKAADTPTATAPAQDATPQPATTQASQAAVDVPEAAASVPPAAPPSSQAPVSDVTPGGGASPAGGDTPASYANAADVPAGERVRVATPDAEAAPQNNERLRVADPEVERTRQAEIEHQQEIEQQQQIDADTALNKPLPPRPVTPDDVPAQQATRSERPLTPQEYEDYRARLIAKGVPPDQIMPGEFTAFHPDGKGGGHITVGPDVNPLPEGQRPIGLLNPANAHVDAESALSHESIGHREAELAGQAYANDPQMEEAQASARAAVLDPDLTPQQREILMRDSAGRLIGRDNDDNTYMYMERYEAPGQGRSARDNTPAAGAARTPDQFRPQDQQPSIIINDPVMRDAAVSTPARPDGGDKPAPAASAPAGAPQTATPTAPLATAATPVSAMPGSTPNAAAVSRAVNSPGNGGPSNGGPNSGGPGNGAPGSAPGAAGPGKPKELGWTDRAAQVGSLLRPHLFGIGDGEAAKPEEVEAQQRKQFTADNQPAKGVERVNPAYPPPPGTPAQLEAMQAEISTLLAQRAQAEEEAALQRSRADQCVANQGPVQQTVDDTTQGISAVQAHAQSVAAHDAANQAQQQRQTEAQGLVSGYPSRATGLAVLEVPLLAWQGFTSLASHLPGAAGTKMLAMNQEAGKMQEAFGQMGSQMVGLDSAQPAQQAALEGDSAKLGATATQAGASDGELHTAQAGAQGLQQANNAAQSEAEQLHADATKQGQQKDEAATKKQEEAKTLSEQMQAWATAHKAARQAAIAATQKRLQADGKLNVKVAENA